MALFQSNNALSTLTMPLDVEKKNVCLMHTGKGRGWVKEAYSIVLMQMHVNAPEGG